MRDSQEQQKTILLVEDEALIAIMEKETLKQNGFHVIVAHNGRKAIELVRTTPAIDLILMDINLGRNRMDGTETAEIILKDHDIPVLFLSSYAQKEIVEKTEKITSYGYVVKDSGETVLIASIKMALKLHKAYRELREKEETQRKNEARFRSYFELPLVGIAITSPDKRWLHANDRICEMLGYSREELNHLTWSELTYPDDLLADEEQFNRVIAGHTDHYSVDKRFICKGGEIIWTSLSVACVRDADGRVDYFLALLQDITDRKQAQENLMLDESRLESLMRISQYRSETTQELLDFALSEAIALTGSKIGYIYFYDEDRELFTLNTWSKDVMRECTVANAQTTYELHKTGMWGEAVRQRRPILINDFQAVHPLKKGYPEGHARLYKYLTIPVFVAGRIVAVVAVANKEADYDQTDVRQLALLMDAVWKYAEREKAEIALKKSEEKYRTMFDNALEGIFQTTLEGKFISANKALAGMYGYESPEELMGEVTDLGRQIYADPDERTRLKKLLHEKGSIENFEVEALRKDKEKIWVSVNVRVVEDGDGNVYLEGTNEDITARKQAERTLREREKTLEAFFDAAHESMVLIDTEGRVLLSNDTGAQRLGVTPRELAGNCLYDYFPPEVARRRKEQYDKVMATASPVRFEDTRAGRFFEHYCYPVMGDEKGVSGVALFVHDITKRKKAETTLQKTNADLMERKKELECLYNFAEIFRRHTTLTDGMFQEIVDIMAPAFLHPEAACARISIRGKNYISSPFTETPWKLEAPITIHGKEAGCLSVYYMEEQPEEDHGPFLAYETTLINSIVERLGKVIERMEAEKELRESEEKFRLLVEHLPQKIFIKDRFSTYIACNRHFARDLGIEAEAIAGRTDYDFFPEELAEKYRADDRRVTDSDTTISVEEKYVAPSGKEQLIWTSKVPYRDTKGDIIGVMGIFEDITERKKIAEKLFEEQERLRIIFETSPVGIILVDPSGIITFANERMAHMFGCSLHELIGSSYPSHVHPGETSGSGSRMRHLIAGEIENVNTERCYIRKDGTEFWGYLSGRRQTDESGRFINLVGIIQDIDELKRAERNINETNERFDLATRAANLGIWDWDIRKNVLVWDDRMYELYGIRREDFAGAYEAWTASIHPDDAAFSYEVSQQAIRGEREYNTEFRVLRPDGTVRYLKAYGRVIRDASGAPLRMTGINYDITEQKQVENTLLFLLQSRWQGEDFFESLARYLGETMKMDFVCIDRLEDERLSARTLAVYFDGKFEDNISYTLKDTPCGDVVGKTVCAFPRDVRSLFPKDEVLQEMKAEGYMGTTLWNARGEPIGLIALISRRPIANSGLMETILRLVGIRAAGELERRETEEELRRSEERWQFALEGARDGVWDWDTVTNRIFFSAHWKAMLGYSEDEIGDTLDEWESRVHPDDKEAVYSDLARHFRGETAYYRNEHRVRAKGGSYRWILGRGKVTERTQDGKPLRIIGTHTDITERKQAEEQIKSLLSEKELLLREVHHRIKNNMTAMMSLLSLQANMAENPSVVETLRAAGGRLRSMAVLYDKLYRSENIMEIPARRYLIPLVDEIIGAFPSHAEVKAETAIDDFILPARVLFPLGIVINELLTNAMKHAFPNRNDGLITLSATRTGEQVTLSIHDNGQGIPPTLNIEDSQGFGLQLVHMLTDQMEGTVKIDRGGKGTKFVLEFGV